METASLQEIEHQIAQILGEHLNLPPDTVPGSADLTGDLNMDSLDRVEIVMQIEDKFGITLGDDDVDTAKTVRDVAALVQARLLPADDRA